MSDRVEISRLTSLPPPGTHDINREIALMSPLVTKLLKCLADDRKVAEVFSIVDDSYTAVVAAASQALILIRRCRGEFYETWHRFMKETGLAALLDRLVDEELKPFVVCGPSDKVEARERRKDSKTPVLELMVQLQQLWFLPLLFWPHDDPRPKLPNNLNCWALVMPQADETTRSQLLCDLLPALKAMITNEHQAIELRAGAVSHIQFACFEQKQMSFWREVQDMGFIRVFLDLLDQHIPPPVTEVDLDELVVAAVDADGVFAVVTQCCNALLAGCCIHALKAGDATTSIAFAEHYLSSGFLAFVLRILRSFVKLPDPSVANSIASMSLASLQMIATQQGCAAHVLQLLSDCGSTPRELYALLEQAIARGSQAPCSLQGIRMHLKAANVIALLFGRMESEGRENNSDAVGVTMSMSVVKALVDTLDQMLNGTSQGNVTHQAEAILAISISDANTLNLMQSGIINLITKTLLTSQQEVDTRAKNSGDFVVKGTTPYTTYNVTAAREVILGILLNLTLSAPTASAILNFESELEVALENVLADGDSLTPKARELVECVRFEFSVMDGSRSRKRSATRKNLRHAIQRVVQSNAFKRTPASGGPDADADAGIDVGIEQPEAPYRHFMLSYCWAQQETVKRIRAALGERGYHIWIDIESMQGSTVCAMGDAIDTAVKVIFGVSLEYKESSNCRLECQYAHQAGVSMVPMMLQEGYRANGWLGLLLGCKLWYDFTGKVMDDEVAFQMKVDEMCGELGSPDQAYIAPSQLASTPMLPTGMTKTEDTTSPASDTTSANITATPSREEGAPNMSTPTPTVEEQQSTKARENRAKRLGSSSNLAPTALSSADPTATTIQSMKQQQQHTSPAPLAIDFTGVIDLMRQQVEKAEAKLEAQQQENDRLRKELQRARADDTFREQVIALQLRLSTLHAAKSLSDDDLAGLEDIIADALGHCDSSNRPAVVHMVALSTGMAKDDSLARQLRRKFLKQS